MIQSLFKSKILLIIFVYCFAFFANFVEINAMETMPNLFYQGLQESKEGDFINALQTWDELIKEAPQNGIAFSNRGIVRLALGDPEGAIADQKKAIELLPNEIEPRLNKGIAEESLGKWKDAAQDYLWILDKDSENPSALYNLGWVRGSQGNWIAAEKLFREASISKNGFVLAFFAQALANYQLQNFNQAELELRSLIRKYPMFADSRAALTALLWRKGIIGEAESNWIAVKGLDGRYLQKDWLLNDLRWPTQPKSDLFAFLDLTR